MASTSLATARPRSRPTLASILGTEGLDSELEDGMRALETYTKHKDTTKVRVRFKAIGNAPIMKENLFKITTSNRFQAVIVFLRKELRWKADEPLHTYINFAFSPAPDDTVANLYKAFAVEEQLIVNYSTTAAWG
ncbi:ubiquitin-like autophagy protein Apg12-domain-containing protein [Amylostereum chailletii]|nr:ubiquitin-like autophagy protein Apg12-domain-containing protein [Amylostereum chailletii]